MHTRFPLLAVLAVAAALLAACGTSESDGGGSSTPSASKADEKIKAAWVYVGTTDDAGWTHTHDEGRKHVVEELGDQVETTFKESVPEGPQAKQVIEDLVRDGNKIIFATSFGYQDAMEEAAKKHPDVYFEQATGFKVTDNLAQYFGAGEDSIYLAGMAAGAASKKKLVGYVSPFPIPEVIRHINAYALGAQTTNPGTRVRIVWTNTWFDPDKESKAAQSLVSAGVDVLGQGQDSPATGEVAKREGIKWTGYDSDQTRFAPDAWLTAAVYDWGPYYLKRVQAALDGSWKTGNYYGSIADGFTDIAPFGKSVDEKTRKLIEEKRQALIDGEFYEFEGPLYDQSGKLRVPKGERLSREDILTMDWFVKGVIGSPKGSS